MYVFEKKISKYKFFTSFILCETLCILGHNSDKITQSIASRNTYLLQFATI